MFMDFEESASHDEELRSLMRNKNLGDIGIRRIADALRNSRTIYELTLTQNHIGNAGAQHLADALKINQTLQILILDDNDIGDIGAQHLADTLKKNKTLQRLYFRNNFFGETGRAQCCILVLVTSVMVYSDFLYDLACNNFEEKQVYESSP